MPEEGDPAGQPSREPRRRRIAVIAGLVSVLVVAAVVVVVVVLPTGHPAPEPQRYTSLPSPCALVTQTTLARYVSSTASSAQSPSSGGTFEAAGCSWSGLGPASVRLLSVQVVIIRSSSGVTDARHEMESPPTTDCQCTLITRSVTGVGDRAQEVILPATGSGQAVPSAALFVQSGNAVITVNYSDGSSGPARSAPSPAASLLAPMVAAARDALAVLADPAGISVPPAVTSRYAVPAHGCRLVTAATLARYLPRASVLSAKLDPPPAAPAGAVVRACGWDGLPAHTDLYVTADIFGSADAIASAQQIFQLAVASDSADTKSAQSDTTTTRTQPVTGAGDQALAIFQTTTFPGLAGSSPVYDVKLVVWSGNAVLEIDVSYDYAGQAPLPDRSAQLTTVTVVSRGVLAALGPS